MAGLAVHPVPTLFGAVVRKLGDDNFSKVDFRSVADAQFRFLHAAEDRVNVLVAAPFGSEYASEQFVV